MNPRRIIIHGLLILTFCLGGTMAFTAEPVTVDPVATSNPQVSVLPEGLSYEHRSWREGADGPWSAHVVKIALNQPDFIYASTLAKSAIYGLSPVSNQVDAMRDVGEPLAAINGDFFVIKLGPYRGDPIGLQITDGELVSGSTRPAFWFDVNGQPRIGDVQTIIDVDFDQGEPLKAGLNRERGDNDLVLYTPTLGESTRTMGGLELTLELDNPADEEPSVGELWQARVTSVSTAGNTPLNEGQVVLSFGPALAEKYTALEKGVPVSIKYASDPDLGGVMVAVGGGPILIKGGHVVVDDDKVRHPRTAIGMNDESMFWVVVDGRQPELSVGVSLPELATLMLDLGCTEALNLDGGGSTTLWLEGNVMNSPSDGRERSVANALVLMRKPVQEEAPDGVVKPEE